MYLDTSLILNDLLFWCFIVSADALVFTLFYRKMVGRWWWQNPPTKKTYEFKVDEFGWQFSGSGYNPLETIARALDDFTSQFGKDRANREDNSNQQQTEQTATKQQINVKSHGSRYKIA